MGTRQNTQPKYLRYRCQHCGNIVRCLKRVVTRLLNRTKITALIVFTIS
ncbi:hypothetical protein C6Y45_13080 [Alkalicoccus saliphilus]|uniref:Uncharacterized protein n=1 Tax=Alkalicoccus saliphilus TaxID=200989 RepID=A0A2T4U3Z3_9BACI|nr:hypothetical protein C6Y45_13080 [Alkalicoccus saliphilus]